MRDHAPYRKRVATTEVNAPYREHTANHQVILFSSPSVQAVMKLLGVSCTSMHFQGVDEDNQAVTKMSTMAVQIKKYCPTAECQCSLINFKMESWHQCIHKLSRQEDKDIDTNSYKLRFLSVRGQPSRTFGAGTDSAARNTPPAAQLNKNMKKKPCIRVPNCQLTPLCKGAPQQITKTILIRHCFKVSRATESFQECPLAFPVLSNMYASKRPRKKLDSPTAANALLVVFLLC